MNDQIDLFGGSGGDDGDAGEAAEATKEAPTRAAKEAPKRAAARAPELPGAGAAADGAETLLVIDGTALLFRVYYGMPSRQAPNGVEIGAVMGVCHQLLGICRRRPEAHVVVVYDAGQETFRNRIDPRYKANRGDPPDDLVPQFDLVKAASAALGFPSLALVDYEADDLMATLAAKARAAGMGARLVAVDKDLLQSVKEDAPTVDVCDPKTDAITDAAGVRERLGVRPDQVVDYMAMTGDSTDNIQGIKGVGPKAAQALLAAFDSLDGIFENLERIEYLSIRGAKGLARKVEAGRDDALLARRLVRLDEAVPLDIDAVGLREATRWRGPAPIADEVFSQLGIRGPLSGFRRLFDARAQGLV